jgi:hypothetical protein
MDELGFGYSDDSDEVGVTTAVEQTTGNKNSRFSGVGRNISVPMYQWLIVVGAVILLWALRKGLASDLV